MSKLFIYNIIKNFVTFVIKNFVKSGNTFVSEVLQCISLCINDKGDEMKI